MSKPVHFCRSAPPDKKKTKVGRVWDLGGNSSDTKDLDFSSNNEKAGDSAVVNGVENISTEEVITFCCQHLQAQT